MLGNTIKFDHGYGRDSPAVGHFLRLLAALDSPDQRRFLRFVTGSPRLPPGGLAALQVPPALNIYPALQVDCAYSVPSCAAA
jgi:HECT-domain (ubiquitin-transferase)